MTAVYIRAATAERWCRLTTVGLDHHGTACVLGAIPVDVPIEMRLVLPEGDKLCIGCERDREARLQRAPTIDLRPRTRDGVPIAIEDDLAIPRAPTGDW